jgi:hypothetical protein
MAFLEKKLLSKKDLFILFGRNAGTRLYNLIYKCCGAGNYASYTVSLQQSGGDPPTEFQIFNNSLQTIATYNYVNFGEYVVNFDKTLFNSPFDYATILNNSFYVGPDLYTIQVVPIFFDTISITTFKNGVPADGVIGLGAATILEIRNYN